MKHYQWKIGTYDRSIAARLTREGLNPFTAVLLTSRGICEAGDIHRLLSDSLDELYDPLELRDMDRASERIRAAIARGEHVAVYGDYDVDGITSSCLMATYLRSKGLVCEIYIPDRLKEGYGVRCSGIAQLAQKGVTLIVTVDCGITACREAEYARSLGLDMVITDHHECSDVLPTAAVAVVNPKRSDCAYPFKQLAGVGVAFKTVCAVEGDRHQAELLAAYGDLVALGTVADVMPVTGENRIFLRHGLELMRQGSRKGMNALCLAAGVELSQINVNTAGFALAPRLNAAGRVGSTAAAVDLLTTESLVHAQQDAELLCQYNRTRQQLEGEMFENAVEMLRQSPPGNAPIVLSGSDWHQGVAGIVASRLTERFGLPCIMICVKDGEGRGSCRSVQGFSIYEALEACSDLLEGFGGHDMAAGLNIREENIPALRSALADYIRLRGMELTRPSLQIDFEVIKPGLLTVQNLEASQILEPFGSGNPQPTLCMTNGEITSVTPLSGGKHTKFRIRKNRESFDCIFFSKSPEELEVVPGKLADVAFTPQVNEFRDHKSVQFVLNDVIVH